MERDPENESEYYQLRSGRSRFHAHVWHQYPGVIDKVYIGGRRKCVCFSVYLEEEDGICMFVHTGGMPLHDRY